MNLLHLESSPYLLQHASNPVHWKPWSNDSRKLAWDSDKLLIISSGYSACHWCHVMEHECFEDEEVADVMNRHYISIKIDREEHPEVDAVYMKAVQLMSRQGGWPMNVVCLPDGRPVWGGTYFPKRDWIAALEQLAGMYESERQKMLDYADKLHEGLQSVSLLAPAANEALPDISLLTNLIEKWSRSFDAEYGGYGRAPKFMLPNNFRFLLRYAYQNRNQSILEHISTTLTRMAWGGIFDTVGGGFSRYSVDLRWHVPHFEKMLYDNGQLISLYCDAFRFSPDPLFEEVVRKTITFMQRELLSPEGGFYCALDADSINQDGKLEEGAFYVYRTNELKELLGTDYALFAEVFNINEFGHWEHGNYVLIQNKPLDEIAATHKIATDELTEKKRCWEQMLLGHRSSRPRPRLDNKLLTSWNAIALNGLIDAYKTFGDDSYLQLARKNVDFLLRHMLQPEGHLAHNFAESGKYIEGYLDDYALLAEALLNLYSCTFEDHHLHTARKLVDFALDQFYDDGTGFFTYSRHNDLIAIHYEIEDNVIPASNSVMAKNLVKLSRYFANVRYEEIAQRMTSHIVSKIDYPSAFSNWMDVFLDLSEGSFEVAICGHEALREALLFQKHYRPNVLIAGSAVPSDIPLLRKRFAGDDVLFYVCQNKSCQTPVNSVDAALLSTHP